MGLSTKDLADQAYRFALGGIDLIKDDHGLANQPFAPFKERVQRCAEAVRKANQETGGTALYIASLGGPADQLVPRALEAKACGVGGFLVMPGLCGFDTMRMLADADEIALPLISHPAFVGSFVTRNTEGISHYALFGQITRLAGADASIYPNYGGRFAFSRGECYSIVDGSRDPMGNLAPIFPAPGGGMTAERVPEMLELYGKDVIFLIGGGIHRYDPDLVKSSRYFRSLLDLA